MQKKDNIAKLGGTYRRKNILPSLVIHKAERQYFKACWYIQLIHNIAKLGGTYRSKKILPSLFIHTDERQYCLAWWYINKKDNIA